MGLMKQGSQRDEADQQQQDRKSQPQTAAVPGRSRSAKSPAEWLLRSAFDATGKSIEFSRPEERKRHANCHSGKPIRNWSIHHE